MTDLRALIALDRGQSARTIYLMSKGGIEDWLAERPMRERTAANPQKLGVGDTTVAVLPGADDEDWSAIILVNDLADLDAWSLSNLAERLPASSYRLGPLPPVAVGPANA